MSIEGSAIAPLRGKVTFIAAGRNCERGIMGRPKGYQMSQESKDKIAASQRERYEEMRSWREVSEKMMGAATLGDKGAASDLYHGYLSDMIAVRLGIMNMAQFAGIAEEAKVRRSAKENALTDDEIAEIREVIRTEISQLASIYTRLDPPRAGIYGRLASTTSPAERMRLRKQADEEHEGRR